MSRYLEAGEAASELGVSLATLYSYVSRGVIRSEAVAGGGRKRRYRAEDVERLKRRAERRKNPDAAASEALSWGTPVMESEITLVDDERLFYRGRDVSRLCRKRTIEEVASLLWSGSFEGVRFEDEEEVPPVLLAGILLFERLGVEFVTTNDLDGFPGGLSLFDRCQVALPLAAARDSAAYDLRPGSVIRCGVRILNLMTATVGGTGEGNISRRLSRVWELEDETEKLLDAAMILCADHELPVSTFAARCVASSGATPYAVVQAGLAALGGTRHGGILELVEAFFREVDALGDAEAAVTARLRRGDPIPGFGHKLYPSGDPRGNALLGMMKSRLSLSDEFEVSEAIEEVVWEVIGEYPNIDFALVTLARAAGLPEGGALALFALGRTAGWVAHAVEQYGTNALIRPRARYVGEPVRPGDG